MLALMIGVVGFAFVGCDDTTVEDNPIADKVVGSIEGVVLANAGACSDGAVGANVWVHWMSDEVRDSVVTDARGYFLIEGPLPSGDYTLTFVYVGTEVASASDREIGGQALQYETYATTFYVATIPTLDQLKGDIDVNPSGNYYYRFTTGEDGPDVNLYEEDLTVTGQLFSALPEYEGDVAPKDNNPGQALDAISPIGNVQVILSYPATLPFAPVTFSTFTNAEGIYTFTDMPVYDGEVGLTIPAFAYGDSSYAMFDTTIDLMCDVALTVPDIYGIVDCRSVPTILFRNFTSAQEFHYDSNMTIWFSEPMDTSTFEFELMADGSPVTVSYTWSTNDSTLTIDPWQTLSTWYEYVVEIDQAQSVSGCQLGNEFTYLPFRTMDGIRLLATNVETAPGWFNDFQIEDPITLTFNMQPVLDQVYGTLTLTDITVDPDYPVAFASAVDGNVLTITPVDDLEMSHDYKVCYGVFSDITGDYDEGCIEFATEIDPNEPAAVTGWSLAEGTGWRCDWNTKTIKFRWNKVDRAKGYHVYAYDNANERPNTDWVLIATVAPADYLQYQEEDITLPVQFDRYENDGIQTPFTDSTHVWFMIRAFNDAGDGENSASLEFSDTTPPGAGNADDGGNNTITFSQTYGSGDNTVGTDEDTVWISLDAQVEYMDRTGPIWDFIEAGGDESYVLPEANGSWDWRNDSRANADLVDVDATGAFFTVPAGVCAAGDSLTLTFEDNSGNDTTITLNLNYVQPYFTYTAPVVLDTVEAPDHTVSFTITQTAAGIPTIGLVDYWLTLDDGAVLIDTIEDFRNGNGSETAPLEDFWMSDNLARVGLQDANGGVVWWSDYFMVAGIQFTNLDAIHDYDDTTFVYDQLGTDSTTIPMVWTSVGIESLDVYYTDGDSLEPDWSDFGADGIYLATIENTGSYDYHAPSLDADYRTWLALVDADTDVNPAAGDSRPGAMTETGIDITYDFITVTAPAVGATLAGGADYDVVWTVGAGSADAVLVFDYLTAIDVAADPDDTTWSPCTMSSYLNDGTEAWAVPDTTPMAATRLRVTNTEGDSLFMTAIFSITGLSVTTPAADDEWLVGTVQNITWACDDPGDVGDVRIWWSNSGFTDDDSTEISGGATANDGTYPWTVDSPPSATTQIRIWGVDQAVYATSDDFTVGGVTVTAPNGGDVWTVGASATITWDNVGTIDEVDIAYTFNDGGNWIDIALAETNDGSYTWEEVGNITSDELAMVRIRQAGTLFGVDASNALFDIAGIIVSTPAIGAEWKNGTANNISWTEISATGITNPLKIEYSLDGSDGTYFPVPGAASVALGSSPFAWTLNAKTDPNLAASVTAWIKISEIGTGTVWDNNPGAFTISNADPVVTCPANRNTVADDDAWAVTYADADGGLLPTVSYAWDIVNGTPTGVITGVDDGAGTVDFAYTYDAADNGTVYTLIVYADDGLNDTAATRDVMTLTVSDATVTAPNTGAETWANGTTHAITWTVAGTISNTLLLEYSLDGVGGTYFTVPGGGAVAAAGGTFNWVMNAFTDANLAVSSNCWVRITENVTTTVLDVSDAAFDVTNAAPVCPAYADQVTASASDLAWSTAAVTDADGVSATLPNQSWAWNGATPTGAFSGTVQADGTIDFSYTYNGADDGVVFTLDIIADDGIGTDTDDLTLTVTP